VHDPSVVNLTLVAGIDAGGGESPYGKGPNNSSASLLGDTHKAELAKRDALIVKQTTIVKRLEAKVPLEHRDVPRMVGKTKREPDRDDGDIRALLARIARLKSELRIESIRA
jgi:hypothetical protein